MTDHGLIRSWIQRDYESVNGITCPWDGSEAKALTKMLQANPSWNPDEWRVMILNYYESERANGDRPRTWIPHISKWALGPLDRYGNLKFNRPAHRVESKQSIATAECLECGNPIDADEHPDRLCSLACGRIYERRMKRLTEADFQ